MDLIEPVVLRSPEVLLKAPWDTSTDLWNLGALISELLYYQTMFSGETAVGEYIEKRHIEEVYNLFGPFPRSLLDKGDKALVVACFYENGEIINPVVKTVGLEVRFGDVEEEERVEFISFVEAMLAIDPQKRKTAKELLKTPWATHDLFDSDDKEEVQTTKNDEKEKEKEVKDEDMLDKEMENTNAYVADEEDKDEIVPQTEAHEGSGDKDKQGNGEGCNL
jgi:serine/threonine protein kinase